MRKIIEIMLIISVVIFIIPKVNASSTLADTINNVVNSTSWTGDPSVISVGTVFGKANLSDFDSASVSNAYKWAWVKEIASEDGYSSQTIDNNVQNMMSSITMTGALPITGVVSVMHIPYNVWMVYDRYLIPLYNQFSLWNKTGALIQLQSDFKNNSYRSLIGFGLNNHWYSSARYYDEWIEDLDIFLKMGDIATANVLWNGVNNPYYGNVSGGNWNEQTQVYEYNANWLPALECEIGFFAAIVGNYKATIGTIPNFDRVSTDLYNKLLINGWNSPLWGEPSAMQHAIDNPELRLQNTLGGIEALQMYYVVSDSAYRTAFVNLLTGGTPAWQLLSNGVFFNGGYSDSISNAEKALLLFLYGVIPDTGSLAIPTNEWYYEDWTSMIPSTLFRFDYVSHTIQIPVYSGNIKFDFGPSIASYNFPSNGVYQVQFNSDWNNVVSVTSVGSLTQNFISESGVIGFPIEIVCTTILLAIIVLVVLLVITIKRGGKHS